MRGEDEGEGAGNFGAGETVGRGEQPDGEGGSGEQAEAGHKATGHGGGETVGPKREGEG